MIRTAYRSSSATQATSATVPPKVISSGSFALVSRTDCPVLKRAASLSLTRSSTQTWPSGTISATTASDSIRSPGWTLTAATMPETGATTVPPFTA